MQLHFESQNLKLNLATGDQCKKTFAGKDLGEDFVPINATLQGHLSKKDIDRGMAVLTRFLPIGEEKARGMHEDVADFVNIAKEKGITREQLTMMLKTALEFHYGDAE